MMTNKLFRFSPLFTFFEETSVKLYYFSVILLHMIFRLRFAIIHSFSDLQLTPSLTRPSEKQTIVAETVLFSVIFFSKKLKDSAILDINPLFY